MSRVHNESTGGRETPRNSANCWVPKSLAAYGRIASIQSEHDPLSIPDKDEVRGSSPRGPTTPSPGETPESVPVQGKYLEPRSHLDSRGLLRLQATWPWAPDLASAFQRLQAILQATRPDTSPEDHPQALIEFVSQHGGPLTHNGPTPTSHQRHLPDPLRAVGARTRPRHPTTQALRKVWVNCRANRTPTTRTPGNQRPL
ncbi:hypothetical protein BH23ACT5_BH23ACT5_06880 [soil metagenome]